MKKFAIIFFILIILTIVGFLIYFAQNLRKKETRVCFRQNCFSAEVSDTPVKRQFGLMFRKSLDQDKGMLFVFDEEGIYPFWMKNTLIPLDMIWIDQDQTVVFVKDNAQPCQGNCPSITPTALAKYVLEINGGLAQKLNIRVADRAEIK